MKASDFADLMQSLKEAEAIQKGEMPASRRWLLIEQDSVVVRRLLELPTDPPPNQPGVDG